jgi:hypothetical protein
MILHTMIAIRVFGEIDHCYWIWLGLSLTAGMAMSESGEKGNKNQ